MKATGIVRRIEARVIITPRAIKRINTGFLAHFRLEKRSKYMKATGIVRRVDE